MPSVIERVERKRLREIERSLKAASKANELQRARLEVEKFDAQIGALLSVHQESGGRVEWWSMVWALPAAAPAFSSPKHLRATLDAALSIPGASREPNQEQIDQAWAADLETHRQRTTAHEEHLQQLERTRDLAKRVLAGEPSAYLDAVLAFSPFEELQADGAEFGLEVHDATRVSVNLRIRGHEAIPSEQKSLTASGKLSVKPLPKKRFHEIYQDYACGSCLRAGREILALLPVEEVIVTVLVPSTDASTGDGLDVPVLSAILTRGEMEQVSFSEVDPSDCIKKFRVRGDAMASKSSGQFAPVEPYSFEASSADEAAGRMHPLKLADAAIDRVLARVRSFCAKAESAPPANQTIFEETAV